MNAEERAEKALSDIAFGRLWCEICESYDNECGCGFTDPKEARSAKERSRAIEAVGKAIRAAQREVMEKCVGIVVGQTTVNMAEVDLLQRIEIEIRCCYDLTKQKENKIVQCRKRAIELVYGGKCDHMAGAEVRQMLVDEFGEETVAALAGE